MVVKKENLATPGGAASAPELLRRLHRDCSGDCTGAAPGLLQAVMHRLRSGRLASGGIFNRILQNITEFSFPN